MPNRIIRESALKSHSLGSLTHGAERLFWRLTMVADDLGRFDAYPPTLKATCFPTLVDCLTTKSIAKWRDELIEKGMIQLYAVSDREYGYFVNWSKYQRSYGLASKFPDPPLNASLPSEKSIHDLLYLQLLTDKVFCGYPLLGVERNVRAGSGYADLVILTEQGRIIVELKRTRADKGAIAQVTRYRGAVRDAVSSCVIAAGLGAGFAISHASSVDVAVIVYDSHGKTELPIKNKHITSCEGLLIPVNVCEIANVSYPISENRESRSENRESRVVKATLTDFDKFWSAYPNKVGKKAARVEWDRAKDRPDIEAILSAIERAKQSTRWLDGFIPNPATWLHQGRWADELPQKPRTVFEEFLARGEADGASRVSAGVDVVDHATVGQVVPHRART